jgi:hypothetical protein
MPPVLHFAGTLALNLRLKFRGVILDVIRGYQIERSDNNKKNKLQKSLVIRETNLLSLINLSLAYVYCSTTLSNH